MKRQFVDSLRCPFCFGKLELTEIEETPVEIREGHLTCRSCPRTFPVSGGIVDFLDPTDESLAREVKGWTELAGDDLAEHLVPNMTALPYYPHPPWSYVGPDFFQIFEEVDFAGQRVIDLGAGRTWSTRFLVTLGRAREAVAVDVLTARFLGLATADLYFYQDQSYFERVRGDAHNLPLPDGWADAVFSCAAIHHSGDLDRLFTEAFRVLRPGGRLVFVCEPVKKASISVSRPDNEETALGINEHFYTLAEYVGALRKAGFSCRRLTPRSIAYRVLYPDSELLPLAPFWVQRLAASARGRGLLRRMLGTRWLGAWLYRTWSLPLSMVATKSRR